MRKKYIFGKKLYISLLTMLVVLITTVATTFAWVGVFANSTFDQFEITIKSTRLDEYGLEISATGERGTFSNYINSIDIKRQILINWGYTPQELINDERIEMYFRNLEMEQCTTLPSVNNNQLISLGDFRNMYGDITTHLFKFDIYISAAKYYDSGNSSNYNLEAYINKDIMVGTKKNRDLFKPYTYPNNYISPYANNLGSVSLPEGYKFLKAGDTINNATLDSSTATRVAFEKYKVVDKYDVNAYSESDKPVSAVIYQQGYDYPVYDSINDIYDFGGILPDDINLATAYFNSIDSRYLSDNYKTISIPDEMYAIRGVESVTKDVIITDETNCLIDYSNPNEIISLSQMMKMTIYFWFEGWDADCFKAIAGSPVTLNIDLSAKNDTN